MKTKCTKLFPSFHLNSVLHLTDIFNVQLVVDLDIWEEMLIYAESNKTKIAPQCMDLSESLNNVCTVNQIYSIQSNPIIILK